MMAIQNLFRHFTLALILVSVVLPILPAQSAFSSEELLYCTPSKGPAGTTVEIRGTSFTPSVTPNAGDETTTVSQVNIYFPNKESYYATAIVDSWGRLVTSITIPAYPSGNYSIFIHDVTAGPLAWVSIPFKITPEIKPEKSSGYIGDSIFINGTGFAAHSNVFLYFDDIKLNSVESDANGNISKAPIVIPECSNAYHTIKAVDHCGNTASATFSSQRQKLIISPEIGPQGREITLTGSGFDAAENITLKMYNTFNIIHDIETNPVSIVTDNTGSFNGYMTLPSCPASTYVIEASDGKAQAHATITVSNAGMFDRSIGYVGANITFYGSGFTPFKYTVVSFNGLSVAEGKTNIYGVTEIPFTIPIVPSGEYTITASDGIYMYTYSFTVVSKASLDINRKSAYTGSNIILNGSGFVPGKVAIISYDGNYVTEQTVTDTESFSANFTVPMCLSGPHVISVTDGINSVETTISVLTQQLVAPKPTTPDPYSVSGTDVLLYWEPLSGIDLLSYTIQIAEDTSFSPDTIVIEKNSITNPQYIFDAEMFFITTQGPLSFFWRVKADIDDKDSSSWSEPMELSISSNEAPLIQPASKKSPIMTYGVLFEIAAMVGLLLFWWVKKRRKSSASSIKTGA